MKIWIEGRGIGKARPRFSSRGRVVHTETRYSHWKKDTVKQIKSLGLPRVLVPVKVDCWFVNFFSSDSDNLVGGILDAMVEAVL
ncbi:MULTISPECIES: RusA family crossover junction endodeoxyribonuclease [Nostocales]|uniref:Uncharacterized protein n=1 Tax=Tolypothrix bouteillei VB521301 TaxID=1479485 RepID=A0A0C1R4R6_9CYAN